MPIQKKHPLCREGFLFDVDAKGKVVKDFPLSRKECFLNKGGKYRHEMEFEAVNYAQTSIDFHHICEGKLIKVLNILFLQGESQRQECHAS